MKRKTQEQKQLEKLCKENPVHLSRQEYREEYLKSDHWRELRSQVITGCKCKVCNQRTATDPHHLRYKHIYDILPTDLLAVCRQCHNKIHALINFGVISETANHSEICRGYRMFNRKFGLRSETCKKLQNQCWNNKLLAFGVLKMKVDDFMKLAGVKFRFTVIQELMRIADKPHWNKDNGLNKPTKRIAKLNKFLEEREKSEKKKR